MSQRNQPCPCGSGKKYKACCAQKRTRTQWLAIGSVVIFAVLAAWVVAGVLRKASQESTPPPGKYWCEKHGQWHDLADPEAAENAGSLPPMGPPPPGKVWSEEHGHWHDAQNPGAEAPAGPPPPGKVWSEEHGHWHDAETAPGVLEPIPEALVSDGG